MKEVVLLRGPSGSGKSSYAKEFFRDYKYCNADSFFVNDRGEYVFNPSLLGQAHAKCMGDFLDHIKDEQPLILVDNTFTRLWELHNYVLLARLHNYRILIFEFFPKTLNSLRACIERNTHNTSTETIAKMALEFEPNEYPDAVTHIVQF